MGVAFAIFWHLSETIGSRVKARWHRRLIALKLYLSKLRSPRRPGIMCEISKLIVFMAHENPGGGYVRIQGALANLKRKVRRCKRRRATVWSIAASSWEECSTTTLLRGCLGFSIEKVDRTATHE